MTWSQMISAIPMGFSLFIIPECSRATQSKATTSKRRRQGMFCPDQGATRAASSSSISPSPPSDGGEGWGEEVRFYWFPLSSVLLYVFFHLPCSAESRTGRWGRHTPCRGCGAGAGALVVLWNRQHAFVGEPEPLTPCVRNSNR